MWFYRIDSGHISHSDGISISFIGYGHWFSFKALVLCYVLSTETKRIKGKPKLHFILRIILHWYIKKI
jgi:hypothetical protein